MNQPLGDAALDQLFRTARTYNGYLDTPVSNDQLEAVWELMKYGPTSANCLPARIVWCVSDESKQKLAALAMPANGEKILQAPATAIIGMDMEFYENLPELFPHTDARSWFVGNDALIEKTAFRNSSLQGGYFILAARALGLDTGAMSGFNNDAVDAEFFAGTKVKSNFISTIGYGDPATIFERSPRPEFARFNKIV
ncbi:MAG TPA: malonic semialdehyde reductase [Sphingorhabdus sp.]|uniref:malonic semialdehyde reductase n=1 Tax=Sphingorhabdus sp. TaxID=1902408 RepID=UPI002B8118B0|nr:malonic semialdehyde reductase [Sphingorhabdus sp.]HMT40911.1 malonic semialdehyde reductase [Sphingorhabdus sp.]HMU21704.1 malonic semialdehyde reductase [Sphingorhabdus sp.]